MQQEKKSEKILDGYNARTIYHPSPRGTHQLQCTVLVPKPIPKKEWEEVKCAIS